MSPIASIPFTLDGRSIKADAPKAQIPDAASDAIAVAAENYRQGVMHLHYDIADRDVTLTAANCPAGRLLFNFGDNTGDLEERIQGGDTPEVTHTYPSDGVFVATVRHENGTRAQLEIPVNFPPHQLTPDPPDPEDPE